MADSLLLETGDHLLLETGDRLLLELSSGSGNLLAPFGSLTATITGKRIVNGALASSFGSLTATLAGHPYVPGTMVATLGPLTATVYAVPFAPNSALADLQPSQWDAEITDPPWVDNTNPSPWVAGLSRDSVKYGTAGSTLGSLTATLTGSVVP